MKLHGLSHNPRVRRVLITAQYTGAEINVEHFFPRGQPEEVLNEYKKKNPNALVPTLEAPEGPIYETNAIIRYLARSNEGSNIYGKNDFEKAQIDQYLDWVILTLEPALLPIFVTVLGHIPYNKEAFEGGIENGKKLLRILDDRLKQNKYLVGDSVTLADIAVVSLLSFFFRFVFDEKFRKPFPNLTKYYESVANEEKFKNILGKPYLCKTALPVHGSN